MIITPVERRIIKPDPMLFMPGAGVGVDHSGHLWSKPFPMFPLTVPGLILFMYGDAMTHTGQGTAITNIRDLSSFVQNASGANITGPVTADLEKYNGHTSALIETNGHWEHSGAGVSPIPNAVNPSFTVFLSAKLVTNSVLSTVGWANTAVNARWDFQASRGGANRDMACVKRRDTGATTSNDGVQQQDAGPTVYEWSNVGTTVSAFIGGDSEPLSAGGVQTSGALTADVNNVFSFGAQIVAGVATATSRMYVRAGIVYSGVVSVANRAGVLEWLANDAYQLGI